MVGYLLACTAKTHPNLVKSSTPCPMLRLTSGSARPRSRSASIRMPGTRRSSGSWATRAGSRPTKARPRRTAGRGASRRGGSSCTAEGPADSRVVVVRALDLAPRHSPHSIGCGPSLKTTCCSRRGSWERRRSRERRKASARWFRSMRSRRESGMRNHAYSGERRWALTASP